MIFLPIKPEYAFAIHNREKKVEFRKVKIKRRTEKYCIVYASSPVKKIIGYFEIEKIEENSPAKIWNEYSDRGAISSEAFNAYYKGNSTAVVFKIKKYVPLKEPVDPRDKISSFSIPQSFCYLEKAQVKQLFAGKNEESIPMEYVADEKDSMQPSLRMCYT